MFGSGIVAKGLSLGKVISGISKTLSIANQVIPIYQQAKPMIQNAKTAFSVLKEFSTADTKDAKSVKNSSSNVVRTTMKKKTISPSISYTNNPVFFV